MFLVPAVLFVPLWLRREGRPMAAVLMAVLLPVFSVLEDIAREARTAIHDQYLSRLAEALSPAGRAMIDGLLKRGNDPLTGWNALKREPKRPTNRKVRHWLQHLENLKRLADQMPPLEIPPSKLRFFRDSARAYDAARWPD